MSTAADLVKASRAGVPAIEVDGVVRGMPMITLAPGVRLRGGVLEFGAQGVRLTWDNVLEDVTVHCPEHEAAILDDTSVTDFGTLTLRGVRTTGQVLLLAREAVRSGHVAAADVVVEAADVRGRVQRPHGFGADALQGGFTWWNPMAMVGRRHEAVSCVLVADRVRHVPRRLTVMEAAHHSDPPPGLGRRRARCSPPRRTPVSYRRHVAPAPVGGPVCGRRTAAGRRPPLRCAP
ncbi:hypothetical protein AB0E83_16570 [Streptomyces sp. NPDC035033]|uniref:hypothetical protein n=1 Tax=Streptomyces sp. NPDC035033 TaxID=3155368 RepID=UPI0034070A57